jgi:hypothetical protein
MSAATPVNHRIFDVWLEGYNENEGKYLIQGFNVGFPLGHGGVRHHRVSVKNSKSIEELPEVMQNYIDTEISLNRLA